MSVLNAAFGADGVAAVIRAVLAVVNNAGVRLRNLRQRRTRRLEACQRTLEKAGWHVLVPLTSSLPLASIVMRGSEKCGVGLQKRPGRQWCVSRQQKMLSICRAEGLDGVVLIGNSHMVAALDAVAFVAAPNAVEWLEPPTVAPTTACLVDMCVAHSDRPQKDTFAFATCSRWWLS